MAPLLWRAVAISALCFAALLGVTAAESVASHEFPSAAESITAELDHAVQAMRSGHGYVGLSEDELIAYGEEEAVDTAREVDEVNSVEQQATQPAVDAAGRASFVGLETTSIIFEAEVPAADALQVVTDDPLPSEEVSAGQRDDHDHAAPAVPARESDELESSASPQTTNEPPKSEHSTADGAVASVSEEQPGASDPINWAASREDGAAALTAGRDDYALHTSNVALGSGKDENKVDETLLEGSKAAVDAAAVAEIKPPFIDLEVNEDSGQRTVSDGGMKPERTVGEKQAEILPGSSNNDGHASHKAAVPAVRPSQTEAPRLPPLEGAEAASDAAGDLRAQPSALPPTAADDHAFPNQARQAQGDAATVESHHVGSVNSSAEGAAAVVLEFVASFGKSTASGDDDQLASELDGGISSGESNTKIAPADITDGEPQRPDESQPISLVDNTAAIDPELNPAAAYVVDIKGQIIDNPLIMSSDHSDSSSVDAIEAAGLVAEKSNVSTTSDSCDQTVDANASLEDNLADNEMRGPAQLSNADTADVAINGDSSANDSDGASATATASSEAIEVSNDGSQLFAAGVAPEQNIETSITPQPFIAEEQANMSATSVVPDSSPAAGPFVTPAQQVEPAPADALRAPTPLVAESDCTDVVMRVEAGASSTYAVASADVSSFQETTASGHVGSETASDDSTVSAGSLEKDAAAADGPSAEPKAVAVEEAPPSPPPPLLTVLFGVTRDDLRQAAADFPRNAVAAFWLCLLCAIHCACLTALYLAPQIVFDYFSSIGTLEIVAWEVGGLGCVALAVYYYHASLWLWAGLLAAVAGVSILWKM